MKRVLTNGALAGIAGGLALAAYMLLFGRGPINDALRYEEELAHDAEGAGHVHDALFSQGVQELGGALGLLIFGLALGVIFAIVHASIAPRLGAMTHLGSSVRLGLIGFWVIVLVPFLKYPANPPAIGDPDTINNRTILYFTILGLSIVLVNAVWHFVTRMSRPATTRAWTAAGLYGLGLALMFIVLPSGSDPIDAPSDLIWNFRLASLGGLVASWSAMALTLGTLMTSQQRKVALEAEAQPTRAPAQ